MARRRLLTILATSVMTVGLASGPVLAQDLASLTETLEDTVASTTEEVADTTDDAVDTLTGETAPEEDTTSTAPTTEETASEDDALLDVGTGDGTLDVDLDVDVAPSDEDGSPQLEVDGGVTIADQEVDLGGAADPIEDAVDPDPEPSTSPTTDGSDTTSDDDTTTRPRSRPGGFLAGGGVVAAGADPRPASASTGSERSTGGQGFSGFGSFDRGDFGPDRFGGGTMRLDRVPDPEVAPPLAGSAPSGDTLEASPELPSVAGESTPAVLATETPMGDDSPLTAALRALAGALVLATGAAWTRATRDA